MAEEKESFDDIISEAIKNHKPKKPLSPEKPQVVDEELKKLDTRLKRCLGHIGRFLERLELWRSAGMKDQKETIILTKCRNELVEILPLLRQEVEESTKSSEDKTKYQGMLDVALRKINKDLKEIVTRIS